MSLGVAVFMGRVVPFVVKIQVSRHAITTTFEKSVAATYKLK